MILKRFRLRDYRCFEDTGWIPLNRFSVFIGQNDGGKSSALHALRILLAQQNLEDADHRQIGVLEENGEPVRAPQVIVELETDHDGSLTVLRAHRIVGGNTLFEVQDELVEDDRLNQDLAALTLQPLKELCTSLGIRPQGNQSRKDTFLDALLTHKESLPKHTGWKPVTIQLKQALPICLIYDETSVQDPETAVRNFATSFYRGELQSTVFTSTEELRKTVQRDLNEKAKEIARILKTECDEVDRVEIPIADEAFTDLKVSRVRVTKTDGTDVDWTRIGRGKKREMSLAVFRWQNEILTEHLAGDPLAKPVVVLFDEPDINLDYRAQCRVTQSLEAMCASDRCQAIVATHSHSLIDSVPIDALVFFGRDLSNQSQSVWSYKAATNDLEFEHVFLKALGVSNASFFNERLFVCCSGETEVGALPILFSHRFSKSLTMSGILLLNGFNDEGALDAAIILRKNERRYVLLMDADMRNHRRCGEDKLRYKHGLVPEQVHYLGDKEFEDLFDDETWVEVLNELRQEPVDGETPRVWTVADLAQMRIMDKFSREIQESAEAVSKDGRSKPKLGVLVARKAIELDKVPMALTYALDRIAEMASE